MLRKIKDASLTVKILYLPFVFSLGFLVIGFLAAFLGERILGNVVYPNFEDQILTGHKNGLKALVEAEATSLAEKVKNLNTRDEKLSTVIAETDPIRFFDDGSGYFFSYDMNGVRINVPINKAQNGQNLMDLKDQKGNPFVADFVKASKNGGGFVRYYFEKQGKGIQPKLSYVKLVPGTDFLIGTGVYIDNVESERASLQEKVKKGINEYSALALAVFIGLLGVILLASFFFARSLTRYIRTLSLGLLSSTDQVASASAQISSASQQLAEGASEQAASLEETSSSLEEIASMARQNAQNASQAETLVRESAKSFDEADEAVHALTQSIREITRASEETQKIIKTIDEIAFQTNLLALNAAVEAARAGEAGAGFAVVADEVRNLAMRAAEAAGNTAGLIEGTVKKVQDGSRLVTRAEESFSKVKGDAGTVGNLVTEISAASQEQTQGIEQVNKAVAEMDRVVQQNAANAEESASASEEMSAQAEQMREFVAELVAMVGSGEKGKRKEDATLPGKKTLTYATAYQASVSKERRVHSGKGNGAANGKQPARRQEGAELSPERLLPLDGEF